MILEVYLATYGREDIIAGALQIPMALILLMLVIGLLVTREEERARKPRIVELPSQ